MDRIILHCDLNCFYASVEPVSYTHLDVYKRQGLERESVVLFKEYRLSPAAPGS